MSSAPLFRTETFSAIVSCEKILGSYCDREKFEALCKACPNYGKVWTCPPLAFPSDFIWREYSHLELICDKVHMREEDIAYPAPGGERYPDEMIEKRKREAYSSAKHELEDRLLAKEASKNGSRALFPGTCDRCAYCQRALRKPCVSPETIRYSIEALGGDIPKILEEELGLTFEWAGRGVVPSYYLLVGGILR